jgi:DNA-binding PadR family transcriptional regulator
MYGNDYLGAHSSFRGWHGGHRARRGDMKPKILHLLKEKPMHGYEIISLMEEKSHGLWRPSAGSIYPNLQLLEEQDLVTGKVEAGKRVYSLTDKGKKEAESYSEAHGDKWEEKIHTGPHYEIKCLLFETMGLLKQIARQDSEEKNEKVKKIISEAKDKLAKLLEPSQEK